MKKQTKTLLIIATIIVLCIAVPVIIFMTKANKDDNGGKETQQITTQPDHIHTISDWVIIKEPTCVEEGTRERSCECGLTETEKIHTIDHTEEIDKAIAATCTETGLTEGKHCSVCNTVLVKQETVSAKGHTEQVDKAVSPTCTKDGKTQGKHCSVCNTVLVKQESVKATGHTEVKDNAVAATCSQKGKTEGSHCKTCGTVIKAQKDIDKLAHTEVVDKGYDATCTKNGLSDGKHCSVCGTVIAKQEVISSPGHSYGSWKTISAATCSTSGSSQRTCTVCGDVQTSTDPATGSHNYVNGKCNGCGKYLPGSDHLTYTLKSDGTYACKGFDTYYISRPSQIPTTIVIPAYYEGKRVTSIGYGAFNSPAGRKVKEFIISDGITDIGGQAFYDCSMITSISIPNSVTSIGTAAFYGTDLQAVYIKTTGWKQSGTGSTYDFSDPYAAASIFRKMSFAAYR